MLLKVFIISTLGFILICAEAPIDSSAPYPSAGFRPGKPFNLPGEYLPPQAIAVQQQQLPQVVNLEIAPQRVDFVGQVQDNAEFNKNVPHSAYSPPKNDESIFLKVQGLPRERNPQQFINPRANNRARQRVANRPQNAHPQQQQQFFPAVESINNKPDAQYATAQRQYGAPAADGKIRIINYPEVETQQDNRAAIEAFNAAVEVYNRAATEQTEHAQNGRDANDYMEQQANGGGYPDNAAPTRYTQGQYYVLGPDNTLQRVLFTTSQDEQETRTNGFTAQLKYQPVGQLQDPIYRYNNKGQLVRIVK